MPIKSNYRIKGDMDGKITELAQMIRESNSIVFYGGAGVSTESGVKDYRSEDGLYNTVKEYGVSPEEILSHDFFVRDPKTFYDFYRNYFLCDAKPNAAHFALAELEKTGKLKAVITQNIDGLHQAAGSKNVLELHGTVKRYYCSGCGCDCSDVSPIISAGELPRCKRCGGIIKPRVVLYGEMLDETVIEKAIRAIESADMLIVGGTSLAVSPANTFVRCFMGKYAVMINQTSTDYDRRAQLIIRDKIGTVLSAVMKELERK